MLDGEITKAVRVVVRFYGAAYLLFWIVSQVESWYLLDIFLTESGESLSPIERFAYGLPFLVFGTLFLLPMNLLDRHPVKALVIFLNLSAISWAIYILSVATVRIIASSNRLEDILEISIGTQIVFLAIFSAAIATLILPCAIVLIHFLRHTSA